MQTLPEQVQRNHQFLLGSEKIFKDNEIEFMMIPVEHSLNRRIGEYILGRL